MTQRTYSRVYHEIVEHPRFERVYRNPSALGTWLQMLLTADAMYPMPAPMPPRTPTVRLLIDVGLVIERPGNRYSMRGLTEERERRSTPGRIGAAKRWQSERNAEPLLDETRIEKKEMNNGANAPGAPAAFIGMRPKVTASIDDIRRQEAEAWSKCADCGKLGREHSADGKHSFTAGVLT